MAQLPTNPADFSIAQFLAWVRTKPADEGYDFIDPTNCALCQFLRETGRAFSPNVNPDDWRDGVHSAKRFPLRDGLNDALNCGEDFTFGALATRLEALAPEPSIWISVDAYMSERVRANA